MNVVMMASACLDSTFLKRTVLAKYLMEVPITYIPPTPPSTSTDVNCAASGPVIICHETRLIHEVQEILYLPFPRPVPHASLQEEAEKTMMTYPSLYDAHAVANLCKRHPTKLVESQLTPLIKLCPFLRTDIPPAMYPNVACAFGIHDVEVEISPYERYLWSLAPSVLLETMMYKRKDCPSLALPVLQDIADYQSTRLPNGTYPLRRYVAVSPAEEEEARKEKNRVVLHRSDAIAALVLLSDGNTSIERTVAQRAWLTKR
jgi:hypothetical protein